MTAGRTPSYAGTHFPGQLSIKQEHYGCRTTAGVILQSPARCQSGCADSCQHSCAYSHPPCIGLHMPRSLQTLHVLSGAL